MIRPRLPVFSLILLLLTVMTAGRAAAEARSETLLVLGDSLSAGYGIPRNQEWVHLLQESLTRQQVPLRVVNASISGDTTAGGRARLPALLEREQPDWVLIELGGNDGLRGMSLQAMAANLQAMVDMVEAAGARPLLAGIKIPPNYGSRYRTRFQQVFDTVAQRNDVPLLPFLLDGVGGVNDLMQADRIHPNIRAQPIIAENVWQFLQPLVMAEPADSGA